MKKAVVLFALLGIFSAGCGKPYNSSTADALKYGSNVAGSANFQLARQVMLNSCFTCHGAWANWSEADFVSTGHVVARSPADSMIYYRLIGNDTGNPGDMPQNGALSTEDLNTIKTWILGM
jgi:uncharacterized membrane protein